MGSLRVMDRTGDTKVQWDKTKADEVEAARATFENLKKKGYFAYRVGVGGGAAEQLTEFDVNAERIIMRPPMAAG